MKGEPDIECTKEIVPITKLEAMYRLTKNLRQFTGHRFEVYTEGFMMHIFILVYHSLLDMSKTHKGIEATIIQIYFFLRA